MSKKEKINWHLEKRKISELQHYKNNPRNFTEKGMKDLEKSINSIGFAQPINITQDGIVLSGNARLEKLKEMKVEEIDVYVPNCELSEKKQE